MIRLKKKKEQDFVILNLTDTQLSDKEWEEGHIARNVLTHTVTSLIERIQPDLITITGDLAWAGHHHSYEMLAELLDSFSIPWAPVWGNHDNQGGVEEIEHVISIFEKYKNFTYERGEPSLGNGNYVIAVEEDGTPVEALIMMDTHDRLPFTLPNGETKKAWAKLSAEQLDWYSLQIDTLCELGCKEATLVTHIPIFAYKEAFYSAWKGVRPEKDVTYEESTNPELWNDGYKSSFGVKHEGVGSYPAEDGALDVILSCGLTKNLICGHEHVNNYVVEHKGIRFIYALKTGMGCYWEPCLNGGTVLRVNSDGVYEVSHEYVDISHLL